MLPRSRRFGAAIGRCRPRFRFGRPVLIESKASRAMQSCDAPLSEPSPACSGETSSLAQEGLCRETAIAIVLFPGMLNRSDRMTC